MIRTAEFYGFKEVYIYDKYDLLKEPESKKERANMKHMGRVWTAGALEHITIHKVEDDCNFLSASPRRKIATLLDKSASPLHSFHFQKDDMVIFGNERDGIPDYLLEHIDLSVYLPQIGVTNCLNVAVTFGIVIDALKRT